jgi:hypothetical protein
MSSIRQNFLRDAVLMSLGLSIAPLAWGSSVNVHTTGFSLGRSVGGTDEMQDKWTNRGYSASGQNLTPGVVAVNTSKYPLGTIFKDPQTGYCYIAADKHGNSDASVVDFYKTPLDYKANPQPDSMRLDIVRTGGRVSSTAEGIREQLKAACGENAAPPGESAKDFLAGKGAKGPSTGYTRTSSTLKPTAKDKCAYSATLDEKAECDSTVKLIAKAKVLDASVQKAGTEMVQMKGKMESGKIQKGGTDNLKSAYEGALETALHGDEVLTRAMQVNADLGVEQQTAALRHHQKAEELRKQIEKERKEILAMKVAITRQQLSENGQKQGSQLYLNQKSVTKFKMNNAGRVDTQYCDEVKDPGCMQAVQRKMQGFESKKRHIDELMQKLQAEVQKEQQAMEAAASKGSEASLARANQQYLGAKYAQEVVDKVSVELENMAADGTGALGFAEEEPPVSDVAAVDRAPADSPEIFYRDGQPHTYTIENGQKVPTRIPRALPVD